MVFNKAALPGRVGLSLVVLLGVVSLRANSLPGEFSIDPQEAIAVAGFHLAVYGASESVEPDWTGSYDLPNPGSLASAWQDAVLTRVNYFRALAGVPAWISFDEEYSAKALEGALMMGLHGRLTHFPEEDDFIHYFTEDGEEAAGKSNLALGNFGPSAVVGYIRDHGSNNYRVGHRRWILHPPHRVMGSGDVPGNPANRDQWSANALWVLDGHTHDSYPAVRDDFVAWPPPGYVPFGVVFPRWSLTHPDADFADATVTMTRDGASIPVEIEHDGSEDYGHIVWVPENLDPTKVWSGYGLDDVGTRFSVKIDNVLIAGSPTTFAYEVTLLDPEAYLAITTWAEANANDPVLIVGAENGIGLSGLPFVDSFAWRMVESAAATWTDTAQDLTRFAAQVSGYNPVASHGYGAQGTVFLLWHPSGKGVPQHLTMRDWVIPGESGTLHFDGWRGFSTSGQEGRVEISLDGNLWTAVARFPGLGSGAQPESGFSPHEVDLSAYAGRTLRVRFRYIATPGQPYIRGPGAHVGWAIDNIRFSDTEEVAHFSATDSVTGNVLLYEPSETGTVSIQVRGMAFGGHALPWSPVVDFASDSGVAHSFLRFPAVGSGWRDTAYGWVNTTNWPWVYSPGHGYQFVYDGDHQHYFYDNVLGGWKFSSPAHFPWIYLYNEQTWALYFTNTTIPERWFYFPLGVGEHPPHTSLREGQW